MCFRLVPLSEGRIESDGTLQCAYHGWRFNAEGVCTRVPQAQTKKEEARITHQKKACVTAFPTQVLCTALPDIHKVLVVKKFVLPDMKMVRRTEYHDRLQSHSELSDNAVRNGCCVSSISVEETQHRALFAVVNTCSSGILLVTACQG